LVLKLTVIAPAQVCIANVNRGIVTFCGGQRRHVRSIVRDALVRRAWRLRRDLNVLPYTVHGARDKRDGARWELEMEALISACRSRQS
jgi:hypothetical protein